VRREDQRERVNTLRRGQEFGFSCSG
jgi:hypothetical protein